MKTAAPMLALALLLLTASPAFSQTSAKPAGPPAAKQEAATSKSCPDCAERRKDTDSQQTRTFYFKYAVAPADINEIAASLRMFLPDARTVVVPEQAAVVIRAIPEDMSLAQKIIDDLDRPKKSWRLTYTVTEMDGNNRIGTQHYSMDLVDAQKGTLEDGSRVPIATGSYSSGTPNTAVQTQFTYQNVGITFEATLIPQGTGARLLSSIEQNSVADTSGGNPPGAVVTRNSSLKGAYLLAPNKPLLLGAMDIPGSTHHLEIEALIEPLP